MTLAVKWQSKNNQTKKSNCTNAYRSIPILFLLLTLLCSLVSLKLAETNLMFTRTDDSWRIRKIPVSRSLCVSFGQTQFSTNGRWFSLMTFRHLIHYSVTLKTYPCNKSAPSIPFRYRCCFTYYYWRVTIVCISIVFTICTSRSSWKAASACPMTVQGMTVQELNMFQNVTWYLHTFKRIGFCKIAYTCYSIYDEQILASLKLNTLPKASRQCEKVNK